MRRRVLQLQGNRAHRLEIFCDILSDQAVTSGRAADKYAVHIFQCNGKAVDLRLYAILRLRFVFAQALVKFAQFVKRKHILQALERHGMAHLHKLLQRLSADALAWAVRKGKRRILRFQLLKSSKLSIVVIVRHLRRIFHIIQKSRMFQLFCQLFDLFLWFHDSSCLSPSDRGFYPRYI